MDLIFFAAIAAFFIFKLNKQLGKVDDEEKKKIEELMAKRRQEIKEIQNKIITQVAQVGASQSKGLKDEKKDKILDGLDANTKEHLIKILQTFNIGADFFISGAKSAFEMVINAFSKADDDDVETLKFLLSKKIADDFEKSIKQRKEEKKSLVTNIISVEDAQVVSANIEDGFAYVVMKFKSKQINYVLDSHW